MKIPLEKISAPEVKKAGVNLFVLRLDKIHPYISGNKWYKLKYNIEEAKKQKKDTLLTFGGAFSNHIAATAAAGKELDFKTIGIIRGDELSKNENPTLRFAKECGMRFHFVSREEYRNKNFPKPIRLITQLPNNYVLPEGGTNALAVKGCAEIISLIDIPFDFVCCPVGTGGTIAGIVSSLRENQKAIGFPVLKGAKFLEKDIQKFIGGKGSWELNYDYHFAGYAKHTPELLQFISDFEKQNGIPLEQVYTGKMMFGMYHLITKNYFTRGATVIAIHTGGLQGKFH